MTLFHYYTYFKSLRDFDRIELSLVCVFMACKSQFIYIPIEELGKMFLQLKNNPNEHIPDFLKFEIEFLSRLGFEYDIDTIYRNFHEIWPYLEKNFQIKNEKMKNLALNIINDTYRKIKDK